MRTPPGAPRGRPLSRALRTLAELTKIRIAAVSTLTTATGHVAFARGLDRGALGCSAGVLLMAAGACALNEWQERSSDARMERTRRRPIPSGAISPAGVFAVALGLILCGFAALALLHNPAAALLGLLAVGWYNGLYTPLKRWTAFAVVPGALIGALPPVIGWTAAGGSPTDSQALCLGFFFFIWQVPHFWLLLFLHGGDYEQAGFPTLTALFAPARLARLTFIWMLATAVSALLLPIYGLVFSPIATLGLLAPGLYLAWHAAAILRPAGGAASFGAAFRGINVFAVAVMVLLCADPYLARALSR